jgi:hypothetical protein
MTKEVRLARRPESVRYISKEVKLELEHRKCFVKTLFS